MNNARDLRLIVAVGLGCLVWFAAAGHAAADERVGTGANLPVAAVDHASAEGLSRRPFQTLSSHSLEDAFHAQSQIPADWQARYDRALEKRNAAHIKDWLGVAMIGGSVLLANVSVGNTATCVRFLDCSNSAALSQMYAALGLVSGGAVFGIWGLVQGSSANSELAVLERERLSAGRGSAMRVPIGGKSSLVVAVAQRTTRVNYSVAW